MDREKRKDIVELVGLIAIVGSLVFLIVEVSQNTKAMHSASYQSILNILNEQDMSLATSSELNRIVMIGESTPEDLTVEELSRFTRFTLTRLGQLEFGYLSFMNETISDIDWSAIRPFVQYTMCIPGYRSIWSEYGDDAYSPIFNKFVVNEILTNCVQQ